MRVRTFGILIIVLFLSLLPTGCTLTERGCGEGDLRVGLVSDVTGVADGGLNQHTWQGLQKADEELAVCAQFIESRAQTDYEKDITEFAEQDYDLILTVGAPMADTTTKMAAVYPDIMFVLVDADHDSPADNVQSILFDEGEAAFLAGYLAAAWTDLKDPGDPQVGWVGGTQSDAEEQSVRAYRAGVGYYNDRSGRDVRLLGEYAEAGAGVTAGRRLANSLIDEGVDVVYAAGGEAADGVLLAAKERGKWGIGAEFDPYDRLPDQGDILLTSTVKHLDSAIVALLENVLREGLGDEAYVGTLSNRGVGLAPFHDFEDEIPAGIKEDLTEIQEGMLEGTIDPGLR